MVTPDGAILTDKLVGYGACPGYPDVYLKFLVDDGSGTKREIEIVVTGYDASTIARHITETLAMAKRD